MYYYAFSFTNLLLPFPTSYSELMIWLQAEYPNATIKCHYEEGKRGILHIHGMIKNYRKIYISRLKKHLDSIEWNYDFGFVKSKAAWTAYCTKDTKIEQQILIRHTIRETEFHNPRSDSLSFDLNESDSESEEYIEEPVITDLIIETHLDHEFTKKLNKIKIV